MNVKSKVLGEQIISKIVKIYDKLIESYELTSHVSR
jgi:hypothetical protein